MELVRLNERLLEASQRRLEATAARDVRRLETLLAEHAAVPHGRVRRELANQTGHAVALSDGQVAVPVRSHVDDPVQVQPDALAQEVDLEFAGVQAAAHGGSPMLSPGW